MPGDSNPDVKVWCALTPSQHELGAVISVPSLSGRELRLAIKPNSNVVANRGTKTMKGEGFYVAPPSGGRDKSKSIHTTHGHAVSHLDRYTPLDANV